MIAMLRCRQSWETSRGSEASLHQVSRQLYRAGSSQVAAVSQHCMGHVWWSVLPDSQTCLVPTLLHWLLKPSVGFDPRLSFTNNTCWYLEGHLGLSP